MVNNAKDSNRYFQISEKCNSEYKSLMPENTKACIGHAAYTTVGQATMVLGAIGNALDDIIRIAVPASAAGLRAASI
ncbi:unnamed protein product, partial [Rotaria magnacalcarata]